MKVSCYLNQNWQSITNIEEKIINVCNRKKQHNIEEKIINFCNRNKQHFVTEPKSMNIKKKGKLVHPPNENNVLSLLVNHSCMYATVILDISCSSWNDVHRWIVKSLPNNIVRRVLSNAHWKRSRRSGLMPWK